MAGFGQHKPNDQPDRADHLPVPSLTGIPIRPEPVEIPGLRSVAYRAHPIHDQIADKYTAKQGTYAGRSSTHYRDLADLVLIVKTQTVDAGKLHTALMSEHDRPGTTASAELWLPSDTWLQGYREDR